MGNDNRAEASAPPNSISSEVEGIKDMSEAQVRVAFFKLTNILCHLDVIERDELFDAQIKFMQSSVFKARVLYR